MGARRCRASDRGVTATGHMSTLPSPVEVLLVSPQVCQPRLRAALPVRGAEPGHMVRDANSDRSLGIRV